MSIQVKPQDRLSDAVPGSRLFKDWLTGDLDAGFLAPEQQDAGRELDLAFRGGSAGPSNASGAAPLFGSAWVSGWAESMAEDLPGDEDRALFSSQLAKLQIGEAEVVVTGQQPGFLGGPLYTLYKVATAVALARKRTASGRPTVPVFWSGDDDDDLAEALDPVGWDPASGVIHPSSDPSSATGSGGRSRMVGRLASDPWSHETALWLEQASSGAPVKADSLPADLAAIWRAGVAEGLTWSRLSRRALLRVFTGCGLMVVSGDDPGLHEVAGPLYEKILNNSDALADQAGQRGRELTARGWHAQINARSLARPLFTVEGDQRVPFMPGTSVPEPAFLRPGVMLRSPVQDWLLKPAAVVVGPGELAYLRQLDPLYEKLGITRPPIVPRLFAWLLPPGFDPTVLRDFRERKTTDPDLAAQLADEAEEKAGNILTDILTRELDVEKERAGALAKGRTRRWRKGVAAMLADEIARSRRLVAPVDPSWVFPEGMRQERHLAYLCAAALWGGDLVTACLEAAARHLENGSRNNWCEFALEVPDLQS
jgi:hypothetical protein